MKTTAGPEQPLAPTTICVGTAVALASALTVNLSLGLAGLALLSFVSPARADESEDAALQDIKSYRELAAHDGWKIYFKKNTLDIWRGNEPYKGMKNGHASFAVTWRDPLELPTHAQAVRSASISYIFSCSPPVASVFAKVVFFSSAFVPRNDSLGEQWHAHWLAVKTDEQEEAPDAPSWRGLLDGSSLAHWRSSWQKIYQDACRQ